MRRTGLGLAGVGAGGGRAEAGLAKRMRRLKGVFASARSHPEERLAARAFDHAEMLRETQRARVAKNRSMATRFIDSHPKLSWVAPETGTIGFVRLEGGDVDGLVERLLANGSLVTPGRFFGVADHFRIGFGMEEGNLEDGLNPLGSALKTLNNN